MTNETKYIKDNSYSTCISDKNNKTQLAGNIHCEALPIQIISEPLTMKVNTYNGYWSHEFIMVKYQQDTFIVLNNFHENYKSMLNHKKDLRYLLDN